MNPSVSVIIPTHNRAQMVCDCVQSVLDTNYPALEVIVVDDCSPDDTGARIAARFGGDERVKYLRNEKNLQLGRSRTRGAQSATGELLLFMDDDNIIDHDMLKNMASDFSAFPNAGLIAPMAIHVNGPKDGQVWTLGSDFHRWSSRPNDYLAGIPANKVPTDRIRYPALYSPNAFMVRKETFDKIGGFDFNLPFYYDDADFGWRIKESGLDNWVLSTAITRHQNFMENGDALELRHLGINSVGRAYKLARNRHPFVRKHFTLPQILSVTLIFAPLSAVYYGLVALRNRRPDIAWAYLRGTLAGMLGL